MTDFPEIIKNEEQLEKLMSRPDSETVDMFSGLEGDIIFLGVGGKIGPSLARMAKRASEKSGNRKKIYGVFRRRSEEIESLITEGVIEPIQGDLLDPEFIKTLPLVKNVFFLAGMKFGSINNPSMTWAVNSFLPGLIANHYKNSVIAAYSTGCVYALTTVESGGSRETDTPVPVGEYAQSCLGRERMFEYGSVSNQTPVSLIRLNYSVELRYGVLVDIALKVISNQPVDLTMGYFNVIWQGDANNLVLRSLKVASSPAKILNITGSEIISVREAAKEFGKLFKKDVHFSGKEAETALLSNSSVASTLLGAPKTPINQVIKWTAEWIKINGKLLNKPTHFEVRDGKY